MYIVCNLQTLLQGGDRGRIPGPGDRGEESRRKGNNPLMGCVEVNCVHEYTAEEERGLMKLQRIVNLVIRAHAGAL